MQCPRCQTEMLVSIRTEVEIDHCPDCQGIWLDRGELEKLIERSGLAKPKSRVPVVDVFWDVLDAS